MVPRHALLSVAMLALFGCGILAVLDLGSRLDRPAETEAPPAAEAPGERTGSGFLHGLGARSRRRRVTPA